MLPVDPDVVIGLPAYDAGFVGVTVPTGVYLAPVSMAIGRRWWLIAAAARGHFRLTIGEFARVLRPGGRVVISDIVLDGDLPAALRDDLLAYVGCVAGALRRERYFAAVEAAGLSGVEVLKDVDFLCLAAEAAKDQTLEFVSTRGVSMEDLAGKVRSVTFRATKR